MTYEDFVLEYTKRDMGYHERYATTGIQFGRACWARAQAEMKSDLDRLRRERDEFQQQCSAMAEENERIKPALFGAYSLAIAWAAHYQYLNGLKSFHPEHAELLGACCMILGGGIIKGPIETKTTIDHHPV